MERFLFFFFFHRAISRLKFNSLKCIKEIEMKIASHNKRTITMNDTHSYDVNDERDTGKSYFFLNIFQKMEERKKRHLQH